MGEDGKELVYCRACKRRHRTRGWSTADGSFVPHQVLDTRIWCPKRKVYLRAMRHETTGKLMPL